MFRLKGAQVRKTEVKDLIKVYMFYFYDNLLFNI